MLRQLWDESGWARRIILIMLPLNIISQFLPYNTNAGTIQTDGYLYWRFGDLGATVGIGWQLHPQAYVILACLVVVYLNGFSKSRLFTWIGFWLTVPATFFSIVPLNLGDIGANIGMACLLMSAAAALVSVVDAIRWKPVSE